MDWNTITITTVKVARDSVEREMISTKLTV